MKKNLTLIILITLHTLLYTIHLFSQPCLPGGITFTTQSQIDSFQVNYPNCSDIEGSVIISGFDISNLNGLSVLTSIGGTLEIGYDNWPVNPDLTNLTGLDNMTYIGGDVLIYHNAALTSLAGLNNLTFIGGSLIIGMEQRYNPVLMSLTGLEGLTSIGGDIAIQYNPALSSCEAEWLCDYFANPSGSIHINDNAIGCNSVVEIAYACGSVPCLPYGNYWLYSQSDIDNFQMAFPNCTALQGTVRIYGPGITNISGLENVTSIGERLLISSFNLTSLMELENLTSIGGILSIHNGNFLTSLAGLDNIDASSISNLIIHDNPVLSTCDVQSICNYLGNPNGSIDIYDNASGCNSQQEVEAACDEVSVKEITFDNTFLISPNPVGSYAVIEYILQQRSPVIIQIHDLRGREMITIVNETQQHGEQKVKLKTVGLPSGIYFCVLKINEGIQTIKMIKL